MNVLSLAWKIAVFELEKFRKIVIELTFSGYVSVNIKLVGNSIMVRVGCTSLESSEMRPS